MTVTNLVGWLTVSICPVCAGVYRYGSRRTPGCTAASVDREIRTHKRISGGRACFINSCLYSILSS